MLILCKGKMAKMPYHVPYENHALYSLEELCYYIFHNIYYITEEFFSDALIRWMREEIGEESLAVKCTEMLGENRTSLKDLVITVLCSSDYCKKEEVLEAVEVLDRMERLPFYMKKKIKADCFLKAGRYAKAAVEYRKLIQGSLAVNFTAAEYGNILHNLGIAHFYSASFRESARDFKEAYAANRDIKSLEHYFFVLLIQDKQEEFENEASVMGVPSDEIGLVRDKIERVRRETENLQLEDNFVGNCKEKLRKAFAL